MRALVATGWFDGVSAQAVPSEDRDAEGAQLVVLLFEVVERPWLVGVECTGSRELDGTRGDEILMKKKAALKIGAPLDHFAVWKAARALRAELQERGYPNADVRPVIERFPAPNTALVRFEIADGEKIRVGRIEFTGNRAFSDKRLHGEIEIDPAATFSTARGKSIYTPERLRSDVERLGEFYRNHGYPEARVGDPVVVIHAKTKRSVIPVRKKAVRQIEIRVPIEEGARFSIAAPIVRCESCNSPWERRTSEFVTARLKPGEPYSEAKLMKLRDAIAEGKAGRSENGGASEVQLNVDLNRESGVATPSYAISQRKIYVLRRLEFNGERKFTDRYYRRHIPIREGDMFDPQKLQAGLIQLARTGYIRPVKPEDVRVMYDEKRGSVDLAVHVSEIGQQKFSLIGGQSSLGSTAGIAYSVFNLLGGEELIDSQFEGGPDLLRLALTLSEESVFGTRASLALSVFDYFVRPNLTSLAGNSHFLNTRASGFGAGWGYPVAENESLIVNYTDSRAASRYALDLPQDLTGIVNGQIASQSNAVSHSIGATWDARAGVQHWQSAASVVGGALGGNQNLLRATAEYDVHERDPFSNGRNSWAIRGSAGAVGSFSGDLLYQDRSFAGQELLQGFRSGEIAPYSEVTLTDALGNTTTQAVSTGANLIDAVNLEYRVPLTRRFSATGFVDAGNGWIRPNWLGPDRPVLLAGTNGSLRASTGIELQWRMPVIEQPVRVSFSVNVLRLARTFVLSDGTLFRAPDRKFALGWGMGPRF